MITFAKELNHRPNRQGNYAVFLRVTQDRKIKRVKTTIELRNKKDWNPTKQEIRTSNPDHKLLNDQLDKELEKLKQTYRMLADSGEASKERIIKEAYHSEETASPSFLEYVKKRTDEIYDAGQYRNYKKYKDFYNKLTAFQTKRGKVVDVTFKEITSSYVARFHSYLLTLPNERDPKKVLHPNTIEAILNKFKVIVKRAVEIDKIIAFSDNPFLTFKYHGVKTVKEKLDENELHAIIALDLEPYSLIWHCRNYFMFSFYCAGIRAGDLIQLRWSNITSTGRINYQMGKNHKTRDLVLVPQALEILGYYRRPDSKPSDYIFPLLDNDASWAKAITQTDKDVLSRTEKQALYDTVSSKNALINKELKKIARLAGISKPFSFHISRHTFARLAKEKGIDNNHVKSLLAHSSLQITEGYMGNFDTASDDKALSSLFETSKSEEEKQKELLGQLKQLPPEVLEKIIDQLRK